MQFNKGQRLTAGKLNELASEAGQGIDSETGYTIGKSYNRTYTVEQQNLRYAEDLYRIKKARSTIHFTGEDENDPKYNMHYYVQLATMDIIPFSIGNVRNFERLILPEMVHSTYATIYQTGTGNQGQINALFADDQWLARNDGLNDNFFEHWNPEYIPKNNFSGNVELPLCPLADSETSISLVFLQGYNSEKKIKYNIFAFTNLISNAILANLETIKSKFNDSIGGYDDDIDKLVLVAAILLTNPVDSYVDSKIGNSYCAQQNCGALDVRSIFNEPWYLDFRRGCLKEPTVQVGTQKITIDHYLENNEDVAQLQLLSTDIPNGLPTLSGVGDVVIDCVNLSGYYTNFNPDNLSSYSEEDDKYFKPAYMVRYKVTQIGEDLFGIAYYNRYPICPTWEVYSR